MEKQYTFYVVVNDAGEFLTDYDPYGPILFQEDFILNCVVSAGSEKGLQLTIAKFGGKVKRVTVTVEED